MRGEESHPFTTAYSDSVINISPEKHERRRRKKDKMQRRLVKAVCTKMIQLQNERFLLGSYTV